VKVDAANDLALLKVEGKFTPLGGTVATVGFPNIGLQGFAPKLAKGEILELHSASHLGGKPHRPVCSTVWL